MKYDVCSLASSLFWHFPVVLDLDTGKTHTLYSAATASEIARLKSPKRIPHYSESPIYRRYLELARDLGVIDAGDLLERFPRFALTPRTDSSAVGVPFGDTAEEAAFYREADMLIDSIPIHSAILPIGDFLEEFEIHAAKEWCAQEGLEWYDNRPESHRRPLPDCVKLLD